MNSLLALGLVVLIWGMSPVIVRGFGETLPPLQAASAAVLSATVFVTIVFLFFRRGTFSELWQARNEVQANASWIVLSSILAFCAYPFFYFSGIQSPSPVEANVVNYTWPLIAIIWGVATRMEQLSLERCAAIVLGFGGALLASRSISEFSWFFSTVPEETMVRLGQPVLFAFLGAVSYGIYSGVLKKLTRSPGQLNLSSPALFYLLLLIASVVHVLTLFPLLASPVEIQANFLLQSTGLLLLYACLNLATGHLLWLHVIASRRLYDAAIAVYLVPVVSTIALSLLGGFVISNGVLTGLTMILVAVYLSQYERVAVPPLIATCFAVLLSWSLSLAFPINSEQAQQSINISALYVAMLEVLTATFGIFSGFVLTRVIGQYAQSHSVFLSALTNVERGSRHVASPERLDELRRAIVDEYALWIECGPMARLAECRTKVRDLMRDIESNVQGTRREALAEVWGALRGDLQQWRFHQQQVVSSFEWFILITMASTLALVVYNTQWPAPAFILARIIFAAAILLIILSIREYDSNRPMRAASFLIRAQSGVLDGNGPPYIPHSMLDYSIVKKTELATLTELRTNGVQQRIEVIQISSLDRRPGWGMPLLAVVIFFIVAFTTVRSFL